jgi:hypothetical protein
MAENQPIDPQGDFPELPPKEPFSALAWHLAHKAIIPFAKSKDFRQHAVRFLSNGTDVKLPTVAKTTLGKTKPYVLFPFPALEIIEICVSLVEKELESEIRGHNPKPEQEQILHGILTLADSLFPSACTSPKNDLKLHKPVPSKNNLTSLIPSTFELQPTRHAKRLKQYATRLTKFCSARVGLWNSRNANKPLPTLSCNIVVNQEIADSYQRLKILDLENWDGTDPSRMMDSLDAMKDNLGFEATSTDSVPGSTNLSPDDFTADENEDARDQHTDWSSKAKNTINRASIVHTSPNTWTWNYQEDPLETLIEYVATHTKPSLEKAHNLLTVHDTQQSAEKALILNPQYKKNAETYWIIINRIAQHFPATNSVESPETLQKLDAARFALSLETTNRNLGIDPSEFRNLFDTQIQRILNDPKQSATVTRTEILLSTVLQTQKAIHNNWGKQQAETWLEHLQSFGPGSYENSTQMESRRKQTLAKLNHYFFQPRIELSKLSQDPNTTQEDKDIFLETLEPGVNAIYQMSSGKYGLITRRELKTKLRSLIANAEKRNQPVLKEQLKSYYSFVTGISNQIKSGTWYSNAEQNKAVLRSFVHTMLEAPRITEQEFPGSTEPSPQDSLQVSIEYLRTFSSDKELPAGLQTLQKVLDLCRQQEVQHEGSTLAPLLKTLLSPNQRSHDHIPPSRTTLASIENRISTLEGAIVIAEHLQNAPDPVTSMTELLRPEFAILAQNPNHDSQKQHHTRTPHFQLDLTPKTNDPAALHQWIVDIKSQIESQTQRIEIQAQKRLLSPSETLFAQHLANLSALLLQNTGTLPIPPESIQDHETKILSLIERANFQITHRLSHNLKIWKGLHYITQNIASFRADEHFQASASGQSTLKNFITTATQKLTGADPTNILHKIPISATRERTFAANVAIPVALWLAENERGHKTKITKDQYIERLYERLHAWEITREQMQKNTTLEQTIADYEFLQADSRNAINTYAITQCLSMLEDAPALARGLKFQNQNLQQAKQITELNPDLDTPTARTHFLDLQRNHQQSFAPQPPVHLNPNTPPSTTPETPTMLVF